MWLQTGDQGHEEKATGGGSKLDKTPTERSLTSTGGLGSNLFGYAS